MKISATKDGDSHITKSSSGLFLGIVFVLLLIGILALSLWVNELSNASSKVNTKVESRLLILEEQLQLADSTSTEFLSDINSQLQFLDKEIRKLWDLSNKRNKVNITKITEDLGRYSIALKEIAMTQTNDQKNINTIKNQSQKIQDRIEEVAKINQDNTAIQNQIAELNRSILLIEENIQAFDVYRRQNNELLQDIQLQLNTP
jgi:vacuolar-type H+-ATPase subunit I/STV1|tara:strand:- start:1650 stop:2258 length:609 start_codon:yes stop_codon:yes gene_type:complete